MQDCTKIVMILDRSGSMSVVHSAMEEVLNGYIAMQKEKSGECVFSLVQFDDHYERVVTNMPIQAVGTLLLEPRGSTSLLDAIGRTIDEEGRALSAMPEHQRPNKVMFVVVTDGLENTSREYVAAPPLPKAARINDMVRHQRETYNWEFIFLGADQDAISSAAGMGFDTAKALNYANTPAGARGMGMRLNKMSSAYRDAKSATLGKMETVEICAKNGQKVAGFDAAEWDEAMKDLKEKKCQTTTK